jgi:membrane fusion protein (multidrug efflux system)
MAALDLLEEQPRRIEKLQANADALRDGLAREGFDTAAAQGHVVSIGAGTGSEFSVLPAQNATGNWVKVTQRVPVRIAIDERSPRPLLAGLSTDVTVFTDGRRH